MAGLGTIAPAIDQSEAFPRMAKIQACSSSPALCTTIVTPTSLRDCLDGLAIADDEVAHLADIFLVEVVNGPADQLGRAGIGGVCGIERHDE